jgi:hypothetical protein
MGVVIYSKVDTDKYEYYKTVGLLEDDMDLKNVNSSHYYYLNNISENTISVPYSIWSLPHTILFDCYDGDKSTFNRDDIGFIPPHILIEIVDSKKFKSKFDELQSEYDDEFIGLNEDEDSIDYFEPNDSTLKELSPIIEIMGFINKNKSNGISWG